MFGRFAASAAASSMPRMAMPSPSVATRAVATDFEEEEEFDLAQRVREVGEW
ncbi:hypothetical protein D3C86_2162120 [compost metagenome]